MSYRDVFDRLDEEGIDYVVPRKYDYLPEDTVDDDGDVDIILESSQFQSGVTACESVGFSSRERGMSDRLETYKSAVLNPTKSVQLFVRDPRTAMRAVVTGTGPQSTNLRHENEIRYRGAQMVDLRNNLAYKSPENGSRIPVHPSVTEGMFRRRRRRDCFYVPAPSDELAHIVPHCVFDKNGRFSPYYVDRCNALFESVRSDQEQLRVFEDLLGRIFYDADERVFELVANERYSDIRSELRRFSDY